MTMIRTAALVIVIGSALIALAAIAFAAWADKTIEARAAGRVFESLQATPAREVGLVLGTSKYANGRLNSFYSARIRAAAELYQAGKIKAILVSGDNGRADYNEPEQMKADLVALGVPAEYITADYAGFRTLDSIYRAGEVFGLSSYIVVSQEFHLERAIYLADQRGHDVIGYAARTPSGYWGRRVRAREVLARAMAIVDVALLREPRFLGEAVQVNRPPAGDGSF
jgi:SanA protein